MNALPSMAKVEATRLLIAEDNELTRMGLMYGLGKSEAVHIVGHAKDGHEAVRIALETVPQIVLMDLGMPNLDGIAATRAIKEQNPNIRVAVLTADRDRATVMAALAAGADAYCLKDIRMECLLQVLSMVCDGAIWLDPGVGKMVTDGISDGGSAIVEASGNTRQRYNTTLTEREREVLQLIVNGRSNKEIALAISVTTHTVKAHVCNIIRKLGVDDRTQAAVRALQDGMANQPSHNPA